MTYSQNVRVHAHIPAEFRPKPVVCLVCRGRFDFSQLAKCPDPECGGAHRCPHCGQGDFDQMAFLFERIVVVDSPDAAAHVRATVWGRAN